jgi:hypothetical protein
MTTRDDVHRFLRAHRDELVLSVYLEARPADPARRHDRELHLRAAAAAERERAAAASRDERELLERLLGDVFDRIPPDGGSEGGSGWACFAAASGARLELSLPAGVETSVHWGIGAHVVPFIRVAGPESALIAQIDRAHVRLTRWEGGRFETLLSQDAAPVTSAGIHTNEAPRLGFHHGTHGRSGADDAQRQRREDAEHLRHALQVKLAGLPGDPLPIIVGGAAESVAHFMRELPEAIAERTARAESLRMEAPQLVLPLIRRTLHELQARRLGQRVEQLREAAQSNGLAARGIARVSAAAARGAVAELIFSDRAWRADPGKLEQLVQRVMLDGGVIASAGSSGATDELDEGSDGLLAGLRFALSDS